MTATPDSNVSADTAFDQLLDAVRDSGRMVRGERGGSDVDARAEGYLYSLELLRLAIDFYCDQDWSHPRFIPFSSPLVNHTGVLPIQRIQGGFNPDGLYDFAVIDPARTYRITGRRGNGCYLSFSFSGGADGAWPDRTVSTLNDTTMSFADNGDFTIVVGPDAAGPNAVRTEPDMCSVIVRQYFKTPPEDRVPTSLHIALAADDGPAGESPRRTVDQVVRSLGAAEAFVRGTDAHFPFSAGPAGSWFSEPLGYTGEAGALGTTDNVYCMGRWSVGPDEELVVKTTPVDCRYWSLQIWNHWGQSVTLTFDNINYCQVIVNDATAALDPDGGVTIVIGSIKPIEPNWLDTYGWDHGAMIFRFMFPATKPARPEISVRQRS
jgi:Protein of unknown function (DUF1214)